MPRIATQQFTDPHAALVASVAAVGSQGAMARLLGISQPSVWKWLSNKKVLPAEHVLRVEEATGISRHDLRPDLYPREDDAAATPERYNGVHA